MCGGETTRTRRPLLIAAVLALAAAGMSSDLGLWAAEADARAGTLTVYGEHLGSALPLALLDGTPLTVLAASDWEITVRLPAGTTPGRHVLELWRGPLMSEDGSLEVTIDPSEP